MIDDDIMYPDIKILTWNVNGIRSLYKDAHAIKAGLDGLGAEIICFQETKTARDSLDQGIAIVEGYNSYWGFPRSKSGYSGVATYCKNECTPFKAEEGLSGLFASPDATDNVGCYGSIRTEFSKRELKELDSEGRAVITLHKIMMMFNENELMMAVINVHCPAACDNPERLRMKLRFYRLLEIRADALSENGYVVIIVGDLNVWHRPIDHCEPPGEEQEMCVPCHTWIDQVIYNPTGGETNGHIQSYQLLDAFRFVRSEEQNAFTYWSSKTDARSRNYGARIDYILIDTRLAGDLEECMILKDVLGSDHCPVKAIISMEKCIRSPTYPSFCTLYYKEFDKMSAGETTAISKRESDDDTSGSEKESKADNMKEADITSFLKFKQTYRMQGECSGYQSGTESVRSLSSLSSLSSLDSGESISREVCRDKLGACSLSVLNEDESFRCALGAEETAATNVWKNSLTGPKKTPKCFKHGEECIQKIVKIKGSNINRKFWICSRGEGRTDDPKAQCDFFSWDSDC